MPNKKLNIGLVFGGNSSEHEVSIQSAKTIYNALSSSLNSQCFIVNPIYIDKCGFWEIMNIQNLFYLKLIDLLQREKVLHTL